MSKSIYPDRIKRKDLLKKVAEVFTSNGANMTIDVVMEPIREVEDQRDRLIDALIKDWHFIERFLASNADKIDGQWYGNMVTRQHQIETKIQQITGKPWEELK